MSQSNEAAQPDATAPNAKRLLWGGFMAILAAGIGFSIRGGFLDNWGAEFGFTATELLEAHEAGSEIVKLFPAHLGGSQYLKDILAPLPFLKIMPTGGVSIDNVRAFLEAGAVAVGIGGNLVSKKAVTSGDFAQITATARAYVVAIGQQLSSS